MLRCQFIATHNITTKSRFAYHNTVKVFLERKRLQNLVAVLQSLQLWKSRTTRRA